MRCYLLFIFCLVQTAKPCLGQSKKDAPRTNQYNTLKTIEGKQMSLVVKAGQKALVLLFVSPECPLCQSYSLTIKQLFEKYNSQGFEFVAIVPGTEFTKDEIIKYRNSYGLKGIPFCVDPSYSFSKQMQATITPEVFVMNQKKEIVYSGRIDNWAYELGKKRTVITEHDLADVLEKLNKGIAIKPYQTKAVGCFIN
jgi:peroxiredoxin